MPSRIDASQQAIIATAEDAIFTKYAAVSKQYYQDSFIELFYKASSRYRRSHSIPVQVIIKRGTFARVTCVSKILLAFLNEISDVAQVVLLGAGKDTTFFRLIHGELVSPSPRNCQLLRWVEVDYPDVLQEKVSVIEENKQLCGVSIDRQGDVITLRPVVSSSWTGTCTTCQYLAFDLRNHEQGNLIYQLTRLGLDRSSPTLFISECVLMYLPDTTAWSLLGSLSQSFQHSCLCLYEPILGNDAFGIMMQDNLTRANVLSTDSCMVGTRSLLEYFKKLSLSGYVRAVGCDMFAAYETILSADERRVANQCEFLDELEEFMLIMRHYCVVIASTPFSRVGKVLCESRRDSGLNFSDSRCHRSDAVCDESGSR